MKILNAVEFTLPTITGSEKQIAWAQDIIQSAINYIESSMKNAADLADKMIAQYDNPTYVAHKEKEEAKWLEIAKNYAAAIGGKEFAARTVIDNQDRFNQKCIEAAELYYENAKWLKQMEEYNNEH